jgi:hypothetical protein
VPGWRFELALAVLRGWRCARHGAAARPVAWPRWRRRCTDPLQLEPLLDLLVEPVRRLGLGRRMRLDE